MLSATRLRSAGTSSWPGPLELDCEKWRIVQDLATHPCFHLRQRVASDVIAVGGWSSRSEGPDGFTGEPGYTFQRFHEIVDVSVGSSLGVHTVGGTDRPAKGRTSAFGGFDRSYQTGDAAI